MLCAGITTYSPLRKWGAAEGKKVGVVGLGGLGHMGVKFAHAFGAHTVLFTTSESKVADGKRLGADEVVISKRRGRDGEARRQLRHDPRHRLRRPRPQRATWPCSSATPRWSWSGRRRKPQSVNVFGLLLPRRNLAGSLIGGLPETQEMLDFCGKHGVASDIELIRMQQINEAYERMLRSDVKYRFVIDIASLRG